MSEELPLETNLTISDFSRIIFWSTKMTNKPKLIGLALLFLHVETLMSQIILDSQNPGFYDSINNFSMEFYTEMIKDEEENNVVYSPIGSWAMVYRIQEAARDDTLKLLRSALHFKNDDLPVQSIVQDITKVQWRAALYYDRERIGLSDIFEPDTLIRFYTKSFWKFGEIAVNPVEFWKQNEVSQSINDWVKENTNSRFPEVIQPDELVNDLQYAAAIVLYFSSNWGQKFDSSKTAPRIFHLQNGTVKKINTMNNIGSYKEGFLPKISARFIEIPFEETSSSVNISMIVILPNTDVNLTFVERKLKDIELSELLSGKPKLVDLYLPKFELETTINFNSTLKNLGLETIYTDSAELGKYGLPSKVGRIIQRTSIQVAEEGTTTSSVNIPFAIKRGPRSVAEKPNKFQVNRPFLMLICTKNIILFRARITDPIVNQSHEMISRPITMWDIYRFVISPIIKEINFIADDYEKNHNFTNVVDNIFPNDTLPKWLG